MSGILYLLSATLFILSIRGLSSPKSSRLGNYFGIIGMGLAICTVMFSVPQERLVAIISALILGGIIGIFSGQKVKITALPQMIAGFNGLGGAAAVFLASGEILSDALHPVSTSLGAVIGALTFSGSIVAFAKLQGLLSGKGIKFTFQHGLNLSLSIITIVLFLTYIASEQTEIFWALTAFALLLGVFLVLPIGGADMPIVISLLNACSGWAGVGIGFMLNQTLLIITGTIVGAGGSILAYVMTKAMNSSLKKIFFGLNTKDIDNSSEISDLVARSGSPIDAAFIMENSEKVIIVPGFGMAVARAQYALKEMADILRKRYHVNVFFAIHPVAGRMPGHMNVLLAEANVPYDEIFEMEDINR